VIDRGDVGLAVQASSSLPGLFEPVRVNGRLCVDGNLSAPVPVSVARKLGALRVIAVDITFPPAEAKLSDPIDALYQGFSILTRRLAKAERETADVMIEPPIPVHNDMRPSTLKAMIDAGEKATLALMPAISKLFRSNAR
jgi:NTE family protein